MVKSTQSLSLAALIGAAVSGCAPLQQAPLVYASKVAVGVDLSATTTEQPGVSISVGYKQVDAAYVPVAVAKPCDTDQDVKCTDETYGIHEIKGKHHQSDPTGQAQGDGLKPSADAALPAAAAGTKKSPSPLAGAASKQPEGVAVQLSVINKLAEDWAKASNALAEKREELAAKGAQPSDKEKVEKEVKALEAETKTAKEAYQLYVSKNDRTDAYSVFGTFAANTSTTAQAGGEAGAKGEVGLEIGKVFSTGVAAQHLTDGLADYYRGVAGASCLKSVDSLVAKYMEALGKSGPDPEAAAMYDKLAAVCLAAPKGPK